MEVQSAFVTYSAHGHLKGLRGQLVWALLPLHHYHHLPLVLLLLLVLLPLLPLLLFAIATRCSSSSPSSSLFSSASRGRRGRAASGTGPKAGRSRGGARLAAQWRRCHPNAPCVSCGALAWHTSLRASGLQSHGLPRAWEVSSGIGGRGRGGQMQCLRHTQSIISVRFRAPTQCLPRSAQCRTRARRPRPFRATLVPDVICSYRARQMAPSHPSIASAGLGRGKAGSRRPPGSPGKPRGNFGSKRRICSRWRQDSSSAERATSPCLKRFILFCSLQSLGTSPNPEISEFPGRGGLGVRLENPSRRCLPVGPILVDIRARSRRFATTLALGAHFRAIFRKHTQTSDPPCVSPPLRGAKRMDMFLFALLQKTQVSGFLGLRSLHVLGRLHSERVYHKVAANLLHRTPRGFPPGNLVIAYAALRVNRSCSTLFPGAEHRFQSRPALASLC